MLSAFIPGTFCTLSTFILPSILTCLLVASLCKIRKGEETYIKFEIVFQIEHAGPIHQTKILSPNISVKHCASVTPSSQWRVHAIHEITMYVNTSICKFNKTPTYYTSGTGINLHDRGTGIHALYSPSKNGFSLYRRWIQNGFLLEMLNVSQIYEWNVNWIGLYF